MLYRRGTIWWYEFVICGQRIRESTHSGSRSVARRAMERRRRSLEEGINGLSKRPRPVLFQSAASEHLALKEGKWQASTRRIEAKNIEHLCSMFRHTVLFDITAADILEVSTSASARRCFWRHYQSRNCHAASDPTAPSIM